MLGHGSDWWNAFMLLTLGFAALAAIAVVFSTSGVIVSQKKEARESAESFARYKLETEERIREADARTKEAELKLVQLDKKVTPRVISDEDEAAIID